MNIPDWEGVSLVGRQAQYTDVTFGPDHGAGGVKQG